MKIYTKKTTGHSGLLRRLNWLMLYPFLSVASADIDTIPMQGAYGDPPGSMAMVHVYVRFLDQPSATFSISTDPVVPQLTPLSVSHPGQHFDPGLPWTEALESAAFSRRYGFVVDGDSDLRPANTAIGIRFLSATDGLDTWFYRQEPMEFTPIFTTGGSQATFKWNQAMTHPVFAVPAEHGSYAISLEAFLADTANDWAPVAGYAAETFTLNVTAVPEARHFALLVAIASLLAVLWARGRRARTPLRPSRQGFSMIEVLVVLSAIAILASIAIPVLNGVRQHSAQLRCASNLRQLATASYLYAQDHQGEWPRSGHSAPAHNIYPWPRGLLPYLGYGDSSRASLERASRAGGLYHCPADESAEALGYAFNVYLELDPLYDDYAGQPQTWRSPEQMPNPGQTILFGETRSSGGMSDHFMVHFWEGDPMGVASPHQGEANWVFADGRVERLAFARVYSSGSGIDSFHPQMHHLN